VDSADLLRIGVRVVGWSLARHRHRHSRRRRPCARARQPGAGCRGQNAHDGLNWSLRTMTGSRVELICGRWVSPGQTCELRC